MREKTLNILLKDGAEMFSKGAVISLVDAVFGTGLDAVFGSCNVVFRRARGGMGGELAWMVGR